MVAGLILLTSGATPDAHADHGMRMVDVPRAAYFPIAPVLPRTGWTATASDAESVHENGAAGNVLDGDNATIWHSQYTGTGTGAPLALPHAITIDLGAVTEVSGLRYLPRQDGNANGRIGRFTIKVSTDGAGFGAAVATGTWADDATEKTAEFATTSARYVRLTGLTEAGNRGPFTSAAEITLLGAPELDPPATLALSRKGWTATASDQGGGTGADVPFDVLDNDPYTFWSSGFSGDIPLHLPHWVTIDMKAPRSISGLSYLPQLGGGDGTIGAYQVTLSADGDTWSDPVAAGTWADDTSRKYAYFARTTARFVRLTALTEAGGRDPISAAAEINVLAPLNPASAGRWGPVINFPIVPVSAVVLPDDKLLTFSAYTGDAYTSNGAGYTQTAILDLKTGIVTQRQVSNTGHEMFCTGLSMLPDGRVLVAGGSNSAATSIYDPRTATWSAGPALNIPRGYQSDVTLSDGRVFTLGGSWSDGPGGGGGKNGEVYTPNGTWRLLPHVSADSILTHDPAGTYRADNHAWFFAVDGAAVFQAGPSSEMHWFTTTGAGSVQDAGPRADSKDAMNGDAVMYDVGKILTLGGATAYDGVDATARAYTIDISQGPTQLPTVTRLPNMAYARSFANSVVLPNGQVVVVGGQLHAAPFVDRTAVLQPELWTPSTGRFTKLASMAVPRDYHSVAILLPDGRVFSGGGGLCGTCLTNHPDGQILTPPYLLRPDGSARPRPTITSAPAQALCGRMITVHASTDVRSFALIRSSAVTHSVDTDQRRIPLTPVSADHGSYRLALPAARGTLIPGRYLLFALDGYGTPSVSWPVMIG